jgi:hypothetical protein
MAQSNLDKGQKFSGVGNPANPVRPRTLRPGGTEDREEPVQADWINQPADPAEVLGPRQKDTASGYAGNREVGTGDKSFPWPADDTKNSTTPILAGGTNTAYDWGREAPALGRISWPSYASNPGRESPLDPTNLSPERPDFGAPSNESADVSGMGEQEVNLETGPGIGGRGEAGKMPDPNKKQNWA